MRTIKHQKSFLLSIGIFLLSFLSGCGTMSERQVEARLQQLYGKPFTVITSNRIPADERAEGIRDAKVYIAAPESDPYDRFFVYSTIEGESFGVLDHTVGMSDTFELGKLKRLFEESAKQDGFDVSFTYNRRPFAETEEYYYSEICIHIQVNPQNIEQAAAFLSNKIQQFVDETNLTPAKYFVNVGFVLDYREAEWPEDQNCSVNFGWFDNSNWNEAQQKYIHGPLDYSVENIRNTLLHEIAEFKARYPQLTEKSEAPLPPEDGQNEIKAQLFPNNQVGLIEDEKLPHDDIRLWNSETQQWSTYVWNKNTHQYDCQTEP